MVLLERWDKGGGVRGLDAGLEPLVVSIHIKESLVLGCTHISSYFSMSACEYAAPTGTLGSKPLFFGGGRHGLEDFDFQNGEDDLLEERQHRRAAPLQKTAYSDASKQALHID